MAYHPLASDTGSDADNRRSEADRILKIMVETDLDLGSVTSSERRFLEQLIDGDQRTPISPKQLFWLRDIKAKYCE